MAITTGQWLGRWLACRTSPASSTVRGYAAHVRLYLQPHLGPIQLAELTTAHVQAMFTAIIRQHQATGHPVTPATLARIRATLRAALNTAIRHGLITGNPARHVELLPARRPHAVVWTVSGYVFTGLGGDPLAPDRLTRHFRALTAAAGLPPIRLHDLRHGAATLALAAGVELKVVQDMMGHASIVLTADTYVKVIGPARSRPHRRRASRQPHPQGPGAQAPAQREPTRNARLLDGRQASAESPSTRKGHLNNGQPAGQLTPGRTVGHARRASRRGMGDRSTTASRRTGILWTQSGHSVASAKINDHGITWHNPRSERVRRQGLEPRTRGLRVRCSAS